MTLSPNFLHIPHLERRRLVAADFGWAPDTSHAAARGRVLFSVASLFEAWVTLRKSAHTQRAYREDVMSFVKFAGIDWPDQAIALYSVSVKDVLAFREHLVERNAAP